MARSPGKRSQEARALDGRTATGRKHSTRQWDDMADPTRQSVYPQGINDTSEWHYCWVDSQNASNFASYVTPGTQYEPVKVEEFPHLQMMALKDGAYIGCIIVRGDMLFKCPQAFHQAIMLRAQKRADDLEDQVAAERNKVRDGRVRWREEENRETVRYRPAVQADD